MNLPRFEEKRRMVGGWTRGRPGVPSRAAVMVRGEVVGVGMRPCPKVLLLLLLLLLAPPLSPGSLQDELEVEVLEVLGGALEAACEGTKLKSPQVG